jgi:hypothetical protein
LSESSVAVTERCDGSYLKNAVFAGDAVNDLHHVDMPTRPEPAAVVR